jgi:hypothetical protein
MCVCAPGPVPPAITDLPRLEELRLSDGQIPKGTFPLYHTHPRGLIYSSWHTNACTGEWY